MPHRPKCCIEGTGQITRRKLKDPTARSAQRRRRDEPPALLVVSKAGALNNECTELLQREFRTGYSSACSSLAVNVDLRGSWKATPPNHRASDTDSRAECSLVAKA